MDKLNKVIAGMEACRGVADNCNDCPYACEDMKCSDILWNDILAVLRVLGSELRYSQTDAEIAKRITERLCNTGDLISRKEALSALKGVIARTGLYGVSIEVILANVPAVEAEPIKHARWRWGKNSMNQYGAWCSRCGCGWEDKGDDFDRVQGLVIAHKHCPHCGAHMDEEVTDGRTDSD